MGKRSDLSIPQRRGGCVDVAASGRAGGEAGSAVWGL